MKRRHGPTTARPRAPMGPRVAASEPHEQVYGLRAGLAVARRRPDDVLAVAHAGTIRGELTELLRLAQAHGVPCVELSDAELGRIAGSINHEGLCVTTRPRRFVPPTELAQVLARTRGVAVALDRVRNPYNVGAILRTAAFFGVDGMLLGAPAPHPALAPDAVRVAEGGAEHVRLCRTTDLGQTLGRLRTQGVRVIGAESDAEASALGYAYPRPTVLVVGHEREGMSARVRAQCDAVVKIRGSGAIDSLNVSIAASLLIAEFVR